MSDAEQITAALREISDTPLDPVPAAVFTGLPFYGVGLRDLERVAKRWLREHSDATAPQVLALADELWLRAIREEMVTATFLLQHRPDATELFGVRRIDRWGALLDGWELTDNLGGRVTGPWAVAAPEKRLPAIERLITRRNPFLRRLALVVCVWLGRQEDSDRWWPQTSRMVLALREDKEASIPKAISWVLRTHLRHSAAAVAVFLDDHWDELPAIARRETRNKLLTGTKTGKSRRGASA